MLTYEQENTLIAATRADTRYQELRAQCVQLEADYERITSKLCTEDLQLLEQYISLCEEMEYRRTCLAYQLGALRV